MKEVPNEVPNKAQKEVLNGNFPGEDGEAYSFSNIDAVVAFIHCPRVADSSAGFHEAVAHLHVRKCGVCQEFLFVTAKEKKEMH